jgi:hypothetical protein
MRGTFGGVACEYACAHFHRAPLHGVEEAFPIPPRCKSGRTANSPNEMTPGWEYHSQSCLAGRGVMVPTMVPSRSATNDTSAASRTRVLASS